MTYSKEEMNCLITALEEMVKSVESLTSKLEEAYSLNKKLIDQNTMLTQKSPNKPTLRCIK